MLSFWQCVLEENLLESFLILEAETAVFLPSTTFWPLEVLQHSTKGNASFCFVYLFLERGEGKGRERGRNIEAQEKHQSVASCTDLLRDLAHKPAMYPDWELNWQPFSSQGPTP